MNALFFTEGATLRMFFRLAEAMQQQAEVHNVGFHVCDSRFFHEFSCEEPDLVSGRYQLLKEWEIIRDSKNARADLNALAEREGTYGTPFLWDALVCERRIFMGPRAVVTQDYRQRYSHERMMAMLQLCIDRTEAFFDEVKPDFIVSFICVTMAGYVGHLVARQRNIPILNLRPTRIKNYMHAGDGVSWPSTPALEAYERFTRDGIPGELRQEAVEFLRDTREANLKYEGVVIPHAEKGKFDLGVAGRAVGRFGRSAGRLLRDEYHYHFGRYREDNWIPGVFWPAWFRGVVKPLRQVRTHLALGRQYVTARSLAGQEYVFFGLHTEPEVTLLVYARPYLNQIEAARNFARCLPVGMKLVVKDHPCSAGRRPLSYYRKLLRIPNLLLADPREDSAAIIKGSKLIVGISGTICFEGLMHQKPVVTLGACPFNCLPTTMLRHVRDLDALSVEIHGLLTTHQHDENALLCYVSSLIETSAPVDFYGRLLGRGELRSSVDMDSRQETDRQFGVLASYLLDTARPRIARG